LAKGSRMEINSGNPIGLEKSSTEILTYI